MKYIDKGSEPQEHADWKEKDKMYQRGKPSWNRLPTSIKSILRSNIKKEQGFICCYCERALLDNDYHIEHLKPKDKSKFPHLQLDYENLLCSCQENLIKGEPRHCGNSKGNWYKETDFISPLSPDCEEKFKFSFDGHIDAADENDKQALTTIQKLQLDIDKLNVLRKNAIEPFIDDTLSEEELRLFVKGYLIEKEKNQGKYNPFYTTIKYLFAQ